MTDVSQRGRDSSLVGAVIVRMFIHDRARVSGAGETPFPYSNRILMDAFRKEPIRPTRIGGPTATTMAW
jgi:hypothetical protein